MLMMLVESVVPMTAISVAVLLWVGSDQESPSRRDAARGLPGRPRAPIGETLQVPGRDRRWAGSERIAAGQVVAGRHLAAVPPGERRR